MALLVANCPRCNAENMTFDLGAEKIRKEVQFGWKHRSEVFCICRRCYLSTVFVVAQTDHESKYIFSEQKLCTYSGAINAFVEIESFIAAKDFAKIRPPEFIPENIGSVFEEGTTCLSANCYNAAGTMFRLCVELATAPLLPPEKIEGLTDRIRRDLGLRLPWLFDNNKLPENLRDLSACIREDGNDGAHRGTLTRLDAEDLCDFTSALLERLYTEPKKIAFAAERRASRRNLKK